jgi:bifunctional DNA-binding transcriptional regulator/antitoxin component of YhaV-PrlF toxin-antitoxin module
MASKTDADGRLYLPKEIRERHGERYRIVDLPGRIVLVPIDDDPIAAVRDAVGDAFEGESIDDIKAEALETAKAEIDAEVAERRQQAGADESGDDP